MITSCVLLDGENLFYGVARKSPADRHRVAVGFSEWLCKEAPMAQPPSGTRAMWGKRRDSNVSEVAEELHRNAGVELRDVPGGSNSADVQLVRAGSREINDQDVVPGRMVVGSGDHLVLELIRAARTLGWDVTSVVSSRASCAAKILQEGRRVPAPGAAGFALVTLMEALDSVAHQAVTPAAAECWSQPAVLFQLAGWMVSADDHYLDSLLRYLHRISSLAPSGEPPTPPEAVDEHTARLELLVRRVRDANGGLGRSRTVVTRSDADPVHQRRELRIALVIEDLLLGRAGVAPLHVDEAQQNPGSEQYRAWELASTTANRRLETIRAAVEARMHAAGHVMPLTTTGRRSALNQARDALGAHLPVRTAAGSAVKALSGLDRPDPELEADWIAHVIRAVRRDDCFPEADGRQKLGALNGRDITLACYVGDMRSIEEMDRLASTVCQVLEALDPT